MKKVVYKYSLDVKDGLQEILLPIGSEILTIQMQGEILCMWALVNNDPFIKKEKRHIEIFATGQEISYVMGQDWIYRSTFQTRGGSLVFHAFEYLGI
jgi:hypothetical protein